MKRILLLLAFVFSMSLVAQENYKYVIIPKQFSFLNEENQYNLNALTKSFFETEGFTVYYNTDELPQEIASNRCLVLMADVEESNKLFVTNLNVVIKDCMNKVLFESLKGSSREKDNQKAYTIALRDALTSMKGMLKIKNTLVQPTEQVKQEVVEVVPSVKSNTIIDTSQLRAVSTNTGYNLVNYAEGVVLTLYNTSVENVFIADQGYKKGVLLKKINGWYFEYNFDGQVFSEKLEVKF